MACQDCKFFLKDALNENVNGLYDHNGLCKVLPPQITFTDEGEYIDSIWPEVNFEDFCSLFQRK